MSVPTAPRTEPAAKRRHLGRRPLLTAAGASVWAAPTIMAAAPAHVAACSKPGTCGTDGFIPRTDRPAETMYGLGGTPAKARTVANSYIAGFNEAEGWRTGFSRYTAWTPPGASQGTRISQSLTGNTNYYNTALNGSGGGSANPSTGTWNATVDGLGYGANRYLINREGDYYRYDNGTAPTPDDWCFLLPGPTTGDRISCDDPAYAGAPPSGSLAYPPGPWKATNFQLRWRVPVSCGRRYNWRFLVDARWGTGEQNRTLSGGNGAATRNSTQISASWTYYAAGGALLAFGAQYGYSTPGTSGNGTQNGVLSASSTTIYTAANFQGGSNGNRIDFVLAGQHALVQGSGNSLGLNITEPGHVDLDISIGFSRRSYLYNPLGGLGDKVFQRNDDVAISVPVRRVCVAI